MGTDTDRYTGEYAVEVAGLTVDLERGAVNVVSDISFALAPGEILGLIGESGSGKTTVGSALLGHARAGTAITGGKIVVDGVDLLSLNRKELRRYRGRVISYVPQDPRASLNPAMRLGAQLQEALTVHGVASRQQRLARIRQVLDEVKLPSDDRFLRRYPHELSGGQQQRVVLALSFLCRPKVVVLDEPTTGLDVTTQAHVLRTVRELCRSHRTAAVYVSHDLAVVADLADRIAVMYSGRLVEVGAAEEVALRAAHPYSRALLDVVPDPHRRREIRTIRGRVAALHERPDGCVFADRCDFVEPECRRQPIGVVRIGDGHTALCRRTEALPVRAGQEEESTRVGGTPDDAVRTPGEVYLAVRDLRASYGGKEVLHGIDLTVPRGVVTALVGESGSGKTTLARCLGGLHDEATGEVSVDGRRLAFGAHERSAADRREVQYIFQNASEALNPRKTVGRSIEQPLRVLGGADGPLSQRVASLLADVALGSDAADKYPSQLSGGERQRVTIARALATAPTILICDEITSALDVSVQSAILLLLKRLCADSGLTMFFVTHNLAVVRAIADRVVVLNEGRIVEQGPVDHVLDRPQDPYTRQLLGDTPSLLHA
ncbi:ABC transporter ATP-binding protein [Streptomyces viridiviolaceus]|uniref:ABC transporter ATP-binding protein n=1 Tax=Streptomyces viridiviolaceus TaxID=68282 RepID=A0ABW2E6Q7_9ACTN|nr:ABC transporter ATP-binding protein [Streptomyces viridiviolaceus]GHB56730.1 ABC transporter ATP-binding protein [Streptomyces viridiviolaceus]